MKLGSYTGHYTPYKGRWFRSQLEVTWAVFLDKLGWEWFYEPQRFGCWLPDFRLTGHEEPQHVEVKPVRGLREELAQETMDHIAVSTTSGPVLLFGQRPFAANRMPALGWSWERGVSADGDYRPAYLARSLKDDAFGLVATHGQKPREVIGGRSLREMAVPDMREVEALWRASEITARRLAHAPWSVKTVLEAAKARRNSGVLPTVVIQELPAQVGQLG